jgi:hypothetical protein
MNKVSNDYRYIGERYLDSEDGNQHYYDRVGFSYDNPSECLICLESEKECFTKYAHPKAQHDAHTHANRIAEGKASKENMEEYIDYYMLFYRIEYKKEYFLMFDKYRDEYYNSLLRESYRDLKKLCSYHMDSVLYRVQSDYPDDAE